MRAGMDTVLARVVSVFGYARAHHAYLFANKRANRMKVLVHDGFGIWLCARRLHRGRFVLGDVGSWREAVDERGATERAGRGAAVAAARRSGDDPGDLMAE